MLIHLGNSKIEIGVLLPIDIDYSIYGIEYMKGIGLATETLNAETEIPVLNMVFYMSTPNYINTNGKSEIALMAFSTFL